MNYVVYFVTINSLNKKRIIKTIATSLNFKAQSNFGTEILEIEKKNKKNITLFLTK